LGSRAARLAVSVSSRRVAAGNAAGRDLAPPSRRWPDSALQSGPCDSYAEQTLPTRVGSTGDTLADVEVFAAGNAFAGGGAGSRTRSLGAQASPRPRGPQCPPPRHHRAGRLATPGPVRSQTSRRLGRPAALRPDSVAYPGRPPVPLPWRLRD